MDKATAKKHISATSGEGWLVLVDIIFDNKPSEIVINEVFQKWAGLKVDYSGDDSNFHELTDQIYSLSQFICEKCGKSGKYSIIDGWETTLCNFHFEAIDAKKKIKIES